MAQVASDARSEASGSSSAFSGGSRKYRVVSRGSNVDESLFGSSTSKGRKKNPTRKVMIGEVRKGSSCVLSAAVRLAHEGNNGISVESRSRSRSEMIDA